MGALQGRDDPLQARAGRERIERLTVGDRHVAGAAAVAQPGVLGAGAGVVQAGRDRVRLEDLAVLVLHDRRERAVQHTGQARGGQRRAVPAGLDALAGRLDPDQPDLGVIHERLEHADRVRAAAHARDHTVGQTAGPLEDLGPRLVADHPLEVPDQRRVRRRAHARADDVVGRLDVRDPVADGRRHRLLERARARLDRLDARAEQAHSLDVRLLPAHVLGSHVHDALEVEQGAGGGRGHAVLAGAGLGDDPRLAHALGQQRLADRVVDLVGAGVVEVLALEPDRVPGGVAQPPRQVER